MSGQVETPRPGAACLLPGQGVQAAALVPRLLLGEGRGLEVPQNLPVQVLETPCGLPDRDCRGPGVCGGGRRRYGAIWGGRKSTVPRPVRSSPAARHGCGGRRRPPSCPDPLGTGPLGLGDVFRSSLCCAAPFGQGRSRSQRPRGARGQEKAGTPRRHSLPQRPKWRRCRHPLDWARGWMDRGHRVFLGASAATLHRVVFRCQGPTARPVTLGSSPPATAPLLFPSIPTSLAHAGLVRFQDSNLALAAEGGITATELGTWVDELNLVPPLSSTAY